MLSQDSCILLLGRGDSERQGAGSVPPVTTRWAFSVVNKYADLLICAGPCEVTGADRTDPLIRRGAHSLDGGGGGVEA